MKITLAPLRSTIWSKAALGSGYPLPRGWDVVADVTGELVAGALLRNRLTGAYALWSGSGGIKMLPADQCVAELTRIERAA